MKLASKTVTEIFWDCLFETEPEDPDTAVIVEGITCKVGFDPKKLEKHKQTIALLLDQLPDGFHEKKGGGWSFLNACQDKKGNQWTGEHKVMQELFCLGMAIGRVRYALPRPLWAAMPGGVPYLIVTEKEEA